MGRKRKCSAMDIYHVSSRGVNRNLIYEDDQDKQVFLGLLDRYLSRHGGRLLAWCLMGNHFHLLLQMPMGRLACLMHDLNVMYSKYFNKRHDCTGHLFGERYHSVPMQDEAQFVSTVCYIHHNPVAAAMSDSFEYLWSSYSEFVTNAIRTCTGLVLSVFDGIKGFMNAHEIYSRKLPLNRVSADSHQASDTVALARLKGLLGISGMSELMRLVSSERNQMVRTACETGFSVEQLVRLTGIGRGIIESISCRSHHESQHVEGNGDFGQHRVFPMLPGPSVVT